MRVMRGFSAETAGGTWQRVEVELGEIDLENIVRQYLPAVESLGVEQSFQLLELQAEILLTAELGVRFKRQISEQMKKLLEDRKNLIKKIQG